MSKLSRTALVLGATGGIGGETALALSRHGWKIRAFSRTAAPSADTSGWEWVQGDSLDRASVVAAARGASWTLDAGIISGPLLRSVNKAGSIGGHGCPFTP